MARKTEAAKPQVKAKEPFDLDKVPIKYQDQVESMIPPPSVAENYINRQIAGRSDFEIFDMATDTRHNVLMPGPTGSGKTTVARAYASYKRWPYHAVEVSGGFDYGTEIGFNVANLDTKMTDFHYGNMILVIKYGGVLDIAEPNAATPRFLTNFFGVTDGRQRTTIKETGELVHKHDSCLVTASYNPGYAGMVKLNEAFVNRFAVSIPWDYDPVIEEALIGTWSPRLLNMVRNIRLDDKVRTDVGTNVMEEFLLFATHEQGGFDLACFLFESRFPEAEQPIIHNVVEANKWAIAAELKGLVDVDLEPAADEMGDDEDEDEDED